MKMLSKGQIFITGTPRSGTTLIAQLIGNHLEIEMTYDSTNFMRFCYDNYGDLGKGNAVKNLVHDLATRVKKRWNMDLDRFWTIKHLIKNYGVDIGYAETYDAIMYDLLLKGKMGTIWTEKTTMEWRNGLNFLKMFPKGRVIHVIRDPKAVLASWKKFTHAEGNDYLDIIFNCIDSRNKAIENHQERGRKYFPLLYDEFVQSPKDYLQTHCERGFLPISYDESMLDTTNCTDKSGKLWDGNSMFEKRLDGISTKAVDKWKDELEDWEINLVNQLYFDGDTDISNKAREELQKSSLAWSSFGHFVETGEGVEQFPDDPTNPENWESEQEQLNKWKE